jgi:hypothetical protein
MSSKSHKKARVRKQMKSTARKVDAEKWLSQNHIPSTEILTKNMQRYDIEEYIAWEDLTSIGYYDEAQIGKFTRDGNEWEYKFDGYENEMKVVPKGTSEWELNEF